MNFAVGKPSAVHIQALLVQAAKSQLSYDAVGATRDERTVPGFTHDHVRELIGHGPRAFEAACEALRSWTMFPATFTRVHPPRAPIVEGTNVLVTINVLGLTWLTTSRIVYVIDEHTPVRRFGFAYGTLQEHVEQGEERFLVEHLPDDSVWYDLRAFSKPHYWMVRLGYPMARQFQKRFRTESCAVMQQFVTQHA